VVDLIVVVEVATPLKKSWQAELTRLRLFPHWLRIFTVGSVLRLSSSAAATVVVLYDGSITIPFGVLMISRNKQTYTVFVPVVVVRVVLAVVVVETTTVTVGAAI
jgi:hypothetical protein